MMLLLCALALCLPSALAEETGVYLAAGDGFVVSAQEQTADFAAEFKPAENQDGFVVLEIDVSVRNGAPGQSIDRLEFRYENERIAAVESVGARSSTFVRSDPLHMSLQSLTSELEIEVSYIDFDGSTVTRSLFVDPLSADPQVNFSRSASSQSAQKGEKVTLTYRVSNEGGVTLRDVQVFDDMPEVGFVGSIDALYPGDMRELTAQVTVDEDKTSVPRLTYRADGQDQSTVYVLEEMQIAVYNPELRVTLKADDSLVDAGQSVTLVCNVVNEGNVDFPSATIEDATLGTIIEGAQIEAGKAYSWNKVIKPVETLSYAFTVRASDKDGRAYVTQSNAVRVEVEGVGGAASAEDFQVSVTANTPALSAPGEVTFNLVLRNAGLSPISNITVTDRAGEVVQTVSSLAAGDQVLPIAVQVQETGEYFFSVTGTLVDGTSVQRITDPVRIEVAAQETPAPGEAGEGSAGNGMLALEPTPTPIMTVTAGGLSPFMLMLLISIALLIVACVLVLIWLQVRAGRRRARGEVTGDYSAAPRDETPSYPDRAPYPDRTPYQGGAPYQGREPYQGGAPYQGGYDDPYGMRDEIRRAATEYSRPQTSAEEEDAPTVYKTPPRRAAEAEDQPTVRKRPRGTDER